MSIILTISKNGAKRTGFTIANPDNISSLFNNNWIHSGAEFEILDFKYKITGFVVYGLEPGPCTRAIDCPEDELVTGMNLHIFCESNDPRLEWSGEDYSDIREYFLEKRM